VTRRREPELPPREPAVRRRIWLLALAFLFVQVVVLPGAESPFRAPKTVVALVAILLVAGLSVTGALRRGRLELRWSPLATALIALPALQALSALWSASPRLALDAAAESTIWILGALFVATVSQRERLRLGDATAIGAALSGAVLLIQAAGRLLIASAGTDATDRSLLSGLTGNPADLAMAAVLALPLVLAAGEDGPRRWPRRGLALLLSAAAVVSQTLTGIVALALVWAVWLLRQRSRRLWLAAGAAAVVLIVVGLTTGLGDRFERQATRLRHGDWYFLLSARYDGWTAAAEMIRNHPVAGVGADGFTHAYYPSRVAWLDRHGAGGGRAELATHFRFAHCDPLQATAELGIAGVVWMIALVAALLAVRRRGDPLLPLAAAAVVPFSLLHFPTHLAVGLTPIVLVLGNLMSNGRQVVLEPGPLVRRASALAAAVLVAIGCYWQLQRLMLNLWRGGLSHALEVAESLDGEARARQAAMVEAQILPRLPALAGAQPWLWRMVGRARVARGEMVGAEQAFRSAMTLWPHEEAEFGLGIALAAQHRELGNGGLELDSRNRRGEAVVHLARVCRTNPALLDLIDDDELRRAVAEIVDGAAPTGGPAVD
jgi:O-antigen ligase